MTCDPFQPFRCVDQVPDCFVGTIHLLELWGLRDGVVQRNVQSEGYRAGHVVNGCVRHRQGASHVQNYELLERPPESRDAATPWPVHPAPSQILRVSTSHEEGGNRDWGISTTHFSGRDGQVTHLHGARVRFGQPDPETGRRPMETVPGSEFEVEADLVLLALGFTGPVREGLLKELGVELDARSNVAASAYASSVPGIFAAGDMRRGQSLVVWAIQEGREAAAAIHGFLQRTA